MTTCLVQTRNSNASADLEDRKYPNGIFTTEKQKKKKKPH